MDLPKPGIEHRLPALQVDSLPSEAHTQKVQEKSGTKSEMKVLSSLAKLLTTAKIQRKKIGK